MKTRADKSSETKNQAVTNLPKIQNDQEQASQFTDNRPEAIMQRKLKEAIHNSPRVQQLNDYQKMANNGLGIKQLKSHQTNTGNLTPQPIQAKANNTGLPDNLKSGVESLSGYSLDDVKVHSNSDKPAQLNAYAYARGTDIHLGAGQEKHLPHEAWHVVQQKQGRVKPTVQLKGNVDVNDDVNLEREADVMGDRALQMKADPGQSFNHKTHSNSSSLTVQRMTVLEATTIENDFNLVLTPAERLGLQNARFTTALHDALHNNIASLNPWVGDFTSLMRLCTFLVLGGAPDVKTALLIRINDFFGTRLIALNNNKTIADYNAFMNAATAANANHQMYLQVFFTLRTAARAQGVFLTDCMTMLDTASAVAPNPAFFNIVQNAVTNGSATSLNNGNIAATATIIAAHPPGGGFAGFARWGEGNHGGSAANLRGHFYKHVLAFDDDSTTAEALLWWASLNINPTFAQLSTALGERAFTGEENTSIFGNAHPAPGATPTPGAGLTYLIERGIADYPALTAFFIAQYENNYGTYVINQSAAMANCAVHESHDGIFISGRVGDLFIIGRLDAGGGAMGISSGYYATDIASKLGRQILWHL